MRVAVMDDIRPKRAARSLLGAWCQLCIPLPAMLKADVCREARHHGMSQAELGLRIVAAAMADQAWMEALYQAASEGLSPVGAPQLAEEHQPATSKEAA